MKQATFFVCALLVLSQLGFGVYAADASDESTTSASTSSETVSSSLADIVEKFKQIYNTLSDRDQKNVRDFLINEVGSLDILAEANNGTFLGNIAAGGADWLEKLVEISDTVRNKTKYDVDSLLDNFAETLRTLGR